MKKGSGERQGGSGLGTFDWFLELKAESVQRDVDVRHDQSPRPLHCVTKAGQIPHESDSVVTIFEKLEMS